MKIYTYDEEGYFLAEAELEKRRPLKMGTTIAPPQLQSNQKAKFDGAQWNVIEPLRVKITIDNVTNKLAGFDDGVHDYTVNELTDCVASGAGLMAIAGKKFRVPFVRTDSNRKVKMIAEVDSEGNFTIAMNFPTRGDWIVNSDLLNSELTAQELELLFFEIAQKKFNVM